MLGPESTANTIALAMQQGGRTGTQPSPQGKWYDLLNVYINSIKPLT